MLVKATTPCSRIEQDPESTGLVWTEVSKALRTSQLTTADVAILSTSRIYRRQLDGNGALISADTTIVPIGSLRPFSARDPAVLAQIGYVRGDEQKGWEFFGPDESVLLSREICLDSLLSARSKSRAPRRHWNRVRAGTRPQDRRHQRYRVGRPIDVRASGDCLSICERWTS